MQLHYSLVRRPMLMCNLAPADATVPRLLAFGALYDNRAAAASIRAVRLGLEMCCQMGLGAANARHIYISSVLNEELSDQFVLAKFC
jgi:hypothetical protein